MQPTRQVTSPATSPETSNNLVLSHMSVDCKSSTESSTKSSTDLHTPPPASSVKKKRRKKCNCYGKSKGCGGSPPIWNNFDSIVRPDQEIHHILPAQLARSDTQKQYSSSRLHHNSIVMNSRASLMIMFNGNLLDAISMLRNPKGVHTGVQ